MFNFTSLFRRKRREGSEPSAPTTTDYRSRFRPRDIHKVETDKWSELGIVEAEIDRIQEVTGMRPDPFRLESLAYQLTSELAQHGFDFSVEAKEILGVLVDQYAVNQKRLNAGETPMPAVEVAVWREADRRIRQDQHLARGTAIAPKVLEEQVRSMFNEANRRRR